MGIGLLLIVATGLLWGGLGVEMSRRADRRDESPLRFLWLAYLMAAGAAWVFVVDWRSLARTPQPRFFEMVGWAWVTGTLSAVHVLSTQAAMRRGPHSLTWACSQSALAGSFLAGVFLWGEHVAWPGWAGLVLVISALALLGYAKGELASVRPGWKAWLVATWFGIASQQTCASVVSHWKGWHDVGRMRPAVAMTATFCGLGLALLAKGGKESSPWPWREATRFAAYAALSFFCLYPALDRMAARGAAAVVFPLALGTSILTVTLWRIRVRGDRLDRRTQSILALLLLGLLLLSMGR